jgi:hypothetical protein
VRGEISSFEHVFGEAIHWCSRSKRAAKFNITLRVNHLAVADAPTPLSE